MPMNLLMPPSPVLFWICLTLALPVVLVAAWRAPWALIKAHPTRQHALFATVLALGLFWLLKANVRDVIAFHPMLMTVTTMVFGGSLSLCIGTLALAVSLLYRTALTSVTHGWEMAWNRLDLYVLPVDMVLCVLIPVCWTWVALRLVDRWSFKNPLTYALGVGFFGAMAGVLWMGLGALILFAITDSEALTILLDHGLVFVLMLFPEGFSNGAIATVLTVLWPDMLKTYRDDWYLKG